MKSEIPPATTITAPPRRRLRFSLRTLLIATPILAALFAWIGSEKLRHDRDLAAAEHLRSKFNTTWDGVNGRWNVSPPNWSELARGRLYLPYSGLSIRGSGSSRTLQLDDNDWQALEDLRDLKVLKLFEYHGSADEETFSRLHHVQELILWDGEFTPGELRQINALPQLKQLVFSNFGREADEERESRIAKNLASLHGGPQPDITYETVEFPIEPKSWPQLEGLNLMSYQLSDRSLQAISENETLQVLSIAQCDFDPRSLDRLEQMPNLTRLQVFPVLGRRIGGKRIHGPNVDETTLLHWGRHPKLQSLSLGSVALDNFGSDQGNHLGRWPALQRLDLIGVDLPAPAIEEIAAIPNLTSVRLSNCELPPRSLDQLAQVKTLAELRLSQSSADDVLMQKLASLPVLEDLCLEGPEITDQAMRHIAQMAQLKHLTLRETNVGDAGIALLENHPCLETVTIRGGPTTKRSLASLAAIKTISLMKSRLATTDGADAIRVQLAKIQDSGGDVQAELKSLRITPAKPVQP